MEKQNFGFGIKLQVEFTNKDLAKKSGAKWNGDVGRCYWYCPANIATHHMCELLNLRDDRKLIFVKEIIRLSRESFGCSGLHYEPYTREEINDIFLNYSGSLNEETNIKVTKFKKPYVKPQYKKPVINCDSDSEEEEIKPKPPIQKQPTIIKKKLWGLACNYCKHLKLDEDKIFEMEKIYTFNTEPCSGCVEEYKINSIIYG